MAKQDMPAPTNMAQLPGGHDSDLLRHRQLYDRDYGNGSD